MLIAEKVSIPFKRERLSEHVSLRVLESASEVSIPFKRETTRQITISHQKRIIEGRTSFTDSRPLMTENYSPIPFKREGISELIRFEDRV